MDYRIRPELASDRRKIFDLNCAAFETDAEARLVDTLRDGGYVAASLVAEVGSEVVGHILFSTLRVVTSGATIPALSLAPMAVAPGWQRHGIGSRLVIEGLDACRKLGNSAVLVLGHPDFYSRLGFSATLAGPLDSPFGGGDAWMAIELAPGALSGVSGRVRYAPPFEMLS